MTNVNQVWTGMTLNPDSDQELFQRMRAGEEEAFVALYRKRQGGIYRFALHMTGSGRRGRRDTRGVSGVDRGDLRV